MIQQFKMLKQLDLTEEQRLAAKTLLEGERETIVKQVAQLAESHRDLESAIAGGGTEAALREKATALGQLYGDVAVTRAGLIVKLNAMLNEDQKRKAAALRAEEQDRREAQRQNLRDALKERMLKGGKVSAVDLLKR